MKQVEKWIRERRSVRTFNEKVLTAEDRERLLAFARTIENPYGIPVDFVLLDAKEHGLSSPVIVGTEQYMAAKVPKIPHGEEAFGYSFECFVLFARSLGIGTTWIGGTMDRKAFEKAASLKDGERMPCVTPLGYPAEKMSVRETMMRKGAHSDSRAPFEELFFDGDFSVPLTKEKAGDLAPALEAVRLAPSAVNRQPWRLLARGDAVHFFEKKTKGFVSEAVGDMQKIDMGIALCHFALTLWELGREARFTLEDPGIALPANMEYIASYQLA